MNRMLFFILVLYLGWLYRDVELRRIAAMYEVGRLDLEWLGVIKEIQKRCK